MEAELFYGLPTWFMVVGTTLGVILGLGLLHLIIW